MIFLFNEKCYEVDSFTVGKSASDSIRHVILYFYPSGDQGTLKSRYGIKLRTSIRNDDVYIFFRSVLENSSNIKVPKIQINYVLI